MNIFVTLYIAQRMMNIKLNIKLIKDFFKKKKTVEFVLSETKERRFHIRVENNNEQ